MIFYAVIIFLVHGMKCINVLSLMIIYSDSKRVEYGKIASLI